MATGQVLREESDSSTFKARRPKSTRSKEEPEVTVDNFIVTSRFIDTLKKYRRDLDIPLEALPAECQDLPMKSSNGTAFTIDKNPGKMGDNCYISAEDHKNPYLTTNQREFTEKRGTFMPLARPQTSRFQYMGGNTGKNQYAEEFSWKSVPKAQPRRAGTSSGNRRNNPHPMEAFLIWRSCEEIPNLENMSDQTFSEVNKQKMRSTYTKDFQGIPQGVQLRTAYDGFPRSTKTEPIRTTNTTTRIDYRPPVIQGKLRNTTSRFGSNARVYKPAVGCVPSVFEGTPYLQVHSSTEYKKDYKDRFGEASLTSLIKPDALPLMKDYLKKANAQDQEIISRLLHAIDHDREQRYNLQRLSAWDGPR